MFERRLAMVYTFPSHFPMYAYIVAAVAAIAGVAILVMRRQVVIAVIAFGVALLAGGLVGPMLAMDRVVLDDTKLEQTTGFWFSPTVKGFKLADAKKVEVVSETDLRGRVQEKWLVTSKTGRVQELDPGDLWEVNGDDILTRLRQKGIDARR